MNTILDRSYSSLTFKLWAPSIFSFGMDENKAQFPLLDSLPLLDYHIDPKIMIIASSTEQECHWEAKWL